MELKDLKVGDEVFMTVGRTWSNYIYKKVVVEKITPKGFIRADGKLFDQRGNERVKGYYGGIIYPINDKTIAMVEAARKDDELRDKTTYLRQFNFTQLPEELIIKIHGLIKEWEAKPIDTQAGD